MCVGYRTDNLNQIEKKTKNMKSLTQYAVKRDSLAAFTYYTKVVLQYINHICEQVQCSHYYKLLQKTTQPAHLITLISGILIATILMPATNVNLNETELHGKSSSQPLLTSASPAPSAFLKLMYLGSFAAHFGIQIWMTFISGLSLYLALPRHAFGEVQKILFPKYFALNGVLSFITLFTFVKYQNETVDNCILIQIAALLLCFCVELIIRLYMTPTLLQLITERNQIELSANVGMEIGDYKPGSLINRPEYLQIHTSFRKVHMSIAIGNIITIGCTAIHLYYLSARICI